MTSLLEPIISRAHEDRDTVVRLERVLEDHVQRIQELEYTLFKGVNASTVFDKIEERIAIIESNRKSDIMKFSNDQDNMK